MAINVYPDPGSDQSYLFSSGTDEFTFSPTNTLKAGIYKYQTNLIDSDVPPTVNFGISNVTSYTVGSDTYLEINSSTVLSAESKTPGLFNRDLSGTNWYPMVENNVAFASRYGSIAANGGYIVAPLNGANQRYTYSQDGGITWSSTGLFPDTNWGRAVVANNQIFVGGRFTTGTISRALLYITTDAVNWTTRGIPKSTSWVQSITYGNGLYVSILANGNFVASTDLVNWNIDNNTSLFAGSSATMAYGNGYYVAAGNASRLLISTDGLSWTTTPQLSGNITYIHYATDTGTFLASGPNGLFTSTDLINWTTRFSANTGVGEALRVAVYGGGYYVASGTMGGTTRQLLFISTDLVNWTTHTTLWPNTLSNGGIMDIAYSNGRFYATDHSGDVLGYIHTTENIGAPTADGRLESLDIVGVTRPVTPYLNIAKTIDNFYVAASVENQAPRFFISTDKVTWTTRAATGFVGATAATIRNLIYVSKAGGGFLFAGGDSPVGTGTGAIGVSTNGLTWVSRNSGLTGGADLAYMRAVNGNIFYAEPTSRIIRIDDGTSNPPSGFTQITPALTTSARPSYFAYGNGRYLVVANNNGETSYNTGTPTGGGWVTGTQLPGNNAEDMTFANGRFLVISTSTSLFTSTDALNWTTSPRPFPMPTHGHLFSINDIFIHYNESSSSQNFYMSSDGITWTVRASTRMTDPLLTTQHYERSSIIYDPADKTFLMAGRNGRLVEISQSSQLDFLNSNVLFVFDYITNDVVEL